MRAHTGIELIAAERRRQFDVEEFTAEHDDRAIPGTFIDVAIAYAQHAVDTVCFGPPPVDHMPEFWPWDDSWWKPSTDPIRDLVKAGAMIAAEIDRLNRLPKPPTGVK